MSQAELGSWISDVIRHRTVSEVAPIVLLRGGNIGAAVEIAFLYNLKAFIKVLPVWRPSFWISHFRLTVYVRQYPK